MVPELANQLEAVDVWHEAIGHHEIGYAVRCLFERFPAVGGRLNGVSGATEHGFKVRERDGTVVHEEKVNVGIGRIRDRLLDGER
jgi:hypothetical protein